MIHKINRQKSQQLFRASLQTFKRKAINFVVVFCSFQACIYLILIETVRANYLSLHFNGLSQNSFEQNSLRTVVNNLLDKRKLFKRLYAITFSWYIFSFVKNALVVIIGWPYFVDYHLYDCFIFGRFRYYGRTGEISFSILGSFLIMFVIYKYILCSICPEFHFDCIEFLLYDQKLIKQIEDQAKFGYTSTPKRSSYSTNNVNGRWTSSKTTKVQRQSNWDMFIDDDLDVFKGNELDRRGARVNDGARNKIMFVRNIFYEPDEKIHDDLWILRPNRTKASWSALVAFSLFYLIVIISSILFWIYLVIFLLTGNITTNLGYELAYPGCSTWLRNNLRQQNRFNKTYAYSHIYLPHPDGVYVRWLNRLVPREKITVDMLPFLLPVHTEDVQPPTLYNVGRIVIDFLENYYWYYDFLGYFLGLNFIILIYCLDVVLNARGIIERLHRILNKFRKQRLEDFIGPDSNIQPTSVNVELITEIITPINEPKSTLKRQELSLNKSGAGQNVRHRRNSPDRELLELIKQDKPMQSSLAVRCYLEDLQATQEASQEMMKEITEIQALLFDHFNLVDRYNYYISFFYLLLMSLFFLYSLSICTWIVQHTSHEAGREFIVSELLGILFSQSLLCGACITRSYNFKMYNLISSAMALDTSHSKTRLRWMVIMKYYYPKPLFCFRFLGSTEVSWLFVIKVSSSSNSNSVII